MHPLSLLILLATIGRIGPLALTEAVDGRGRGSTTTLGGDEVMVFLAWVSWAWA